MIYPENNLVFSYGTLKRDFPNYPIMLGIKASFIAEAITKFKYPLLQADEWNAPFMFHHKDHPETYKIKGELFEVDQKGMAALDEFEGVDKSYYKRLQIEIDHKTEEGHLISKEAWCYFRYEKSADLLTDPSRFIPFFGEEELKKYTPVHLRPADWKENL